MIAKSPVFLSLSLSEAKNSMSISASQDPLRRNLFSTESRRVKQPPTWFELKSNKSRILLVSHKKLGKKIIFTFLLRNWLVNI